MDSVNAIRLGGVAETAARRAADAKSNPAGGGAGFAGALQDAVGATDKLQVDAEDAVKKFASGDLDDVHQVMLAMNRADLSFRMMLEVRNKLVEAYQEVMRMQA